MLSFFLLILTVLYGYSQFIKKGVISAVLQYQIDLKNPPNLVFAISTFDQKLPDGKWLLKGTRFIGNLTKEGDDFIIYFNTIQTTSGKKEQFFAKSNLSVKESLVAGGVSARIGKTLYQQTKTNILGAIFNSSNNIKQLPSLVLPRGAVLRIDIN